MAIPDFYDQPMVGRIKRIFNDPAPPSKVTQAQFLDVDWHLHLIAAREWRHIRSFDLWTYLHDLCNVPLQQDLFDYLFPVVLIRWWEGQLDQSVGLEREDFYRALDGGQVLYKMMNESRRGQVLDWMTDAFIQGVDAWSHHLNFDRNVPGPDNLHDHLSSFNALGQSVPIIGRILTSLSEVSTIGRAQWWLVFASGVIWNANECPGVPPWNEQTGGGGIYITASDAGIYAHGFLAENLDALKKFLTLDRLVEVTRQSARLLSSSQHMEWSSLALSECLSDPQRIERRLNRLLLILGQDDFAMEDGKVLDLDDQQC